MGGLVPVILLFIVSLFTPSNDHTHSLGFIIANLRIIIERIVILPQIYTSFNKEDRKNMCFVHSACRLHSIAEKEQNQ